jgi:polysaccharide chain length determinant protein (PEP-CTERM system associated)
MLPGRQLTIDSSLEVLRRRRWLLIGPLFLGILGGLLYSRSQPSLYRSDTMLQVVPQRIPDSYVQSTVTSRVEDRLSSIAQQVLSRTQLEVVIVELDLYREERRSKPMEDVFELMTRRVVVAPASGAPRSAREPGVAAFRISFDYDDPRVARDVVAKLAGFFIDRNAMERGSQADQTSAFLEAQLADARARLEAQEQKLEAFRQRNSGRLPTQMQTNMQAIQNTQLALQAMVESVARDRDRKLMLERLYTDAEADPPASAQVLVPSSPAALAGDAASQLPADATPLQRLEVARRVLVQLELRLSPKHPDVVRTRRLVADLERQAAAEDLQRPLSPEAIPDRAGTLEEIRRRDRTREMRAEIESLDRQIAFKEGEERRLREQIGTYQARLEAVPGIESEWVALTRDYDTLQASYRELLSKSENSRMAASLEQRQIGEQFRILDPPRVPLKPHSPNRVRINALGTLAGLGLGLLLVGLVEHRDATMRSEADVLGAIELPVLVLLPFVADEADRRRQRWRRRVLSTAAVGVSVATGALFWFLQLWKFVV